MELKELLFYGGIAVMVAAVLFGLIAFVSFKLRAIKLKHLLDTEYGEQEAKT